MSSTDRAQQDRVVGEVRVLAEALDSVGRGLFLEQLVTAVYDAEKFGGPGGQGLDRRDSRARELFGKLRDEASTAALELAGPAAE